SDGATLLSYSNNNINMWRDGTTFCRPKWGIYRSLNSISELRDEQVRFADFCIAEGSAVCPSGVGGGNPPATFTPTADAYVRSGTYASTAHGATDPNILITKLNSSGSADNDRQTYVRFNLAGTGANISSAVLKLYGKIDDSRSSNVPIGVFSVSSTSWSESTITWNNKPATSGAALATTAVTDATARYYSWDVTSYVQSELNAGRTQVSFALKSAQITDPRITFSSKETGSNPPQLEINTSSAAVTQAAVVYKNQLSAASEDLTLNVYPNPVAQQATIDLNLKTAGRTTVTVYDMQQRTIAVLVNAHLQAGAHRTVFDARPVLPGAYIISVLHNGKTLTKMIARQ
ncbi:MAG TPA: DNRLRE domain-containing protein, partial [Chitinophaga sp.]